MENSEIVIRKGMKGSSEFSREVLSLLVLKDLHRPIAAVNPSFLPLPLSPQRPSSSRVGSSSVVPTEIQTAIQ